MSKILVTGAGGFIGSHVVENLVAKGHDVTAFLRYTSGGSIGKLTETGDVKNRINIVYGDIRSRDDVRRAIEGHSIVIHLAAQIAIPWSYLSPEEFVKTNTIGTLNILMASKDMNVDRIVHMSTSEVYGTAQKVPMDESHPQVSQSPYSASKIAADKLAQSFHKSFNTPVVIARPFNTYGPRQSNRAVIPSIILQVLGGVEKIELGSLTASRDFNFVEDIAENLAIMALSNVGNGEEFNICSEEDYTLTELVLKVGDALGKKLVPVLDEKRERPAASEVERLCGKGIKANVAFGLPYRKTFDEGLAITIEYFKNHYHKEKFTL